MSNDDREASIPLSRLRDFFTDDRHVVEIHAHTSAALLEMLERAKGTRAMTLHVLLTRDEAGRLTATRVEP